MCAGSAEAESSILLQHLDVPYILAPEEYGGTIIINVSKAVTFLSTTFQGQKADLEEVSKQRLDVLSQEPTIKHLAIV